MSRRERELQAIDRMTTSKSEKSSQKREREKEREVTHFFFLFKTHLPNPKTYFYCFINMVKKCFKN